VSTLAAQLARPPYAIPTTVLSIDDFYLPHQAQSTLARDHPNNPLIQHRGQPSTHDVKLALSVFSDLRKGVQTKIPNYDKSAFLGQGDRVPEAQWAVVNQRGQPKIQVVLLEGWCVGFRALTEAELEDKWADAVARREQGGYHGRLGWNKFENVKFVNEALREYDGLTDQFDAFVHLDAKDTMFVYRWRLEQETMLRASKGSSMTDNEVIDFVNGYYPAYELFTDGSRAGVFAGDKPKQLRLVIGEYREVQEVLKV